MSEYVEIALGVPSNRNMIIAKSEIRSWISKANATNQSLHCSYYSFDSEILEHMKIRKTTRNYPGKYYLNKIIIDIDKGSEDDETTLLRVREMLRKLEDDWKVAREVIVIWFSGTGYHLSIPDIFRFTPSPNLPWEVNATLSHYFPEVDTKPLRNTGLMRVGYTINTKSNLYKIPLTYEEVHTLTPEQIHTLAISCKPRNLPKEEYTEYPDYTNLIIATKINREEDKERIEPTRIVTCGQKIFEEGAKKGFRHDNLIRLVSLWRRRGDTFNSCLVLAKDWNARNNEGITDYELVKQSRYIWDRGYTPGCKDKVLVKYCDTKCIHYQKKNLSVLVESATDMEKSYGIYMKSLADKALDIGTILGMRKKVILVPQDYVLFFGSSGLNKTNLAQVISVRLRPKKVLYLNLEFASSLLYRRSLQIATKMTKIELEKYYLENSDGLAKYVDHISVIDISPNLEVLKKTISEHSPHIVFVDTLGLLEVDGYGDKTKIIGEALKSIARRTSTIIVGIHHISKQAAFDDKGNPKELTIQSGLGSSSLHNQADWVWGIEGRQDSTIRTFKSLKARDDDHFLNVFQFNKETFHLTSISV